jgi:hypothetical protein
MHTCRDRVGVVVDKRADVPAVNVEVVVVQGAPDDRGESCAIETNERV